MPLNWTAESQIQLVTIIADREVKRADIEDFLDMAGRANLVGWRKLCDIRAARCLLTFEDVNILGAQLRAAYSVQIPGPLALVVPETAPPEVGRFLGFLATAQRPMRIFKDLGKARKWLDSSAITA